MADTKDKTKENTTAVVTKPDGDAEAGEKPTIVPVRTVVTENKADEKPEPAEPDSIATKDLASPSATRIKIQPISKPEDLKPDDITPVEADKSQDSDDSDDEIDEVTGRNKIKDASQEEQELIDRKAAERQANLDKIALAKTYYLPINQVVRRRSKHVAIVGAVLIILLSLAWLDVSLDAGLIDIPGLKAPTHFFSNK